MPAVKKRKPPILGTFQATMVMAIRIKLGMRCIIRAKNHWGSPRTSRAKMLMKAINRIDKIRGNQ